MIKLLQNRNFILILALLLGVFAGNWAIYLKDFSLYILAFMMLVSLTSFSFSDVRNLKTITKPIFIAVFLNYILFGILLLLIALIFYSPDDVIFKGFIFIVIAPPGVVIVPFTILYGGNSKLSLWGVIGASLFLLFLFPAVIYFTMGNQIEGGMAELFKILFITIIIPLILSIWVQKIKAFDFLKKFKGKIIDWSFFLIVYIVIGLNSDIFINHSEMLFLPTIILIVFLFGFGFAFEWILKLMKINKEDKVSYTLLLLVKNNPFSAVISLQLAGKVAAIPSVALSVVLLVYLIVFSITARKRLGNKFSNLK